jgi:hypothetical protein
MGMVLLTTKAVTMTQKSNQKAPSEQEYAHPINWALFDLVQEQGCVQLDADFRVVTPEVYRRECLALGLHQDAEAADESPFWLLPSDTSVSYAVSSPAELLGWLNY